MRKEELDGINIFVVHDFLSPEECENFIRLTEERGYTDAPINTSFGPMVRKDVRNNERVMIDNFNLARQLWEKARLFIPSPLFDVEAVGLNERFRFYRYDVGQQFAQHMDGCFDRGNGERSELTFMVYLNDGFEGGDTVFSRGRWDPYNCRFPWELRVHPERGKALLFVHDQVHEGAAVTHGRKYVLRTDVMYRSPRSPKG
jgi:predicted 2-oxoglutarate/Fe(II)-dependent dioxygenase YbiX